MAKIRVYELARELGRDTKVLEETVRSLGIEIKNYMSTLTLDDAQRVRDRLTDGKPGAPDGKTVEKRIAKTVIRRRSKGGRRRSAEEAEVSPESPTAAPAPVGGGTASPESAPDPAMETPRKLRGKPTSPRPRAAAASPRAEPGAPRPAPVPVPPPESPVTEAPPSVSAEAAELESVPSPVPGERIALPKGTRRLPGGLADRLAASPVSVQTAPAPKAESPLPAPLAEARGVPDPVDDSEGSGRRVVRNEDGVIVGAASQRSEPKILGFIPLESRRKKQQVIITDASEEDRRGRASQRKQREERAQAQGRRRKMLRPRRGGGPTVAPSRPNTVQMKEEKKRIRMEEAIRVADLAHQMSQKSSKVLKVLWGMGMRGITINSAIDFAMAELVSAEFGYTVENIAFDEQAFVGAAMRVEGAPPRAPVVTIMGHVDHGKTSLLDRIRSTSVATGEAGGITQHIGAYRVTTPKGDVVFLDTPGHQAFTAMRARGAYMTDAVVLVVAADDGVMPTTVEAIEHARAANVPIIVAVNKVDKAEANVGRVKQGLMEHSLVGEEFGGDTLIAEVSAKTGQGIEELLETLALQAELLELRAPSEGRAQGAVIESRIDKGRGTVVSVLVQSGTLEKGDILVAGEYFGKVRRMFDDQGRPCKEVGPSTPVEVLGLDGVPGAGEPVHAVESERDAKQLVQHRREQRRRKESVRSGPSIQEMLLRKRTKVLKVVLKTDVHGSAEAVKHSLEELGTDRVKVEVLKAEVGAINETDVKFARAGDAVILGFNVKTAGKASLAAEQEKVDIHTFGVIYDVIDRVRDLMIGMLDPEYREMEQGEAEVRALFPIPRTGVVAGCRVIQGRIQRSSHVRVVREGQVLHSGTIGSLKHFKEDVKEVGEGFECGIVVDGFDDVQPGDTIQAYELEAIPPSL